MALRTFTAAVLAIGIAAAARLEAAANRPGKPSPAQPQMTGGKMSADSLKDAIDEDSPHLVTAAAPRYLLGLPLVVSLTFENRSQGTELLRLPLFDLAWPEGAGIEVRLDPVGGHGRKVRMKFRPIETLEESMPTPTFALGPGQSRTMLCDLTNLGDTFPAGRYVLRLRFPEDGGRIHESNAVPLELVTPSATDRKEAERLRKLPDDGEDTGAWAPFLASNWHTVTVAREVSPEAKTQLGLHLFLHKAYYGPKKVAQVDHTPLDAIKAPHLAGEVMALRYEILRAQKDPRATPLRAALLQNFPGLAHRVEEADRGSGALATGREVSGAEKVHLKTPPPPPYAP